MLTGSVQWLHPNERDRLVSLAASRLAVDGVLVLHSATPEAWMAGHLASGHRPRPRAAPSTPRPGPICWPSIGFGRPSVIFGGEDRRLERVASSNPDAAAINAAIDTVNALLLGPAEYLLVAVRER